MRTRVRTAWNNQINLKNWNTAGEDVCCNCLSRRLWSRREMPHSLLAQVYIGLTVSTSFCCYYCFSHRIGSAIFCGTALISPQQILLTMSLLFQISPIWIFSWRWIHHVIAVLISTSNFLNSIDWETVMLWLSNILHRLRYLNMWSPPGEHYGTLEFDFVGNSVSLGAGFEGV